MKIHYLILAHKSPEQLEILAKALFSEHTKIYIHIDGYSDIQQFTTNKYLQQHCTFIQNNVKIRWGGFSMVQATINAFNEIHSLWLESQDYVVILSWQDLPIKSQDHIADFLTPYIHKSFIEYRKQPNDERNILNRVIKYHFHDLVVPVRLNTTISFFVWLFYDLNNYTLRNQIASYAIQRVVNFFTPTRKYFLKTHQLYRGSARQILSGKHVTHIVEFLSTNQGKKLIKHFQYTAWPDELFFQTLLLNSSHKDDIINDLQRHVDWKRWPGLPRVLDETDYNAIIQSDKLFARKFELGHSDSLIKMIQDNIYLVKW